MLEPRDRVIGQIASSTGGPPDEVVTVDFGDLVRKLILSEQVIVESHGLKEIPLLIQKFGYSGVKELLESGRLRLTYETLTIGQIGQLADWEPWKKTGILPLGSYAFAAVRSHDHRQMVHEALQQLNDIPALSSRQTKNLRKLVGHRVLESAADGGVLALNQLQSDLTGKAPIFTQSVALATKRHYDLDVDPTKLELRIEQIGNNAWRTDTNMSQITGLGPEDAHNAVGHGLLGVGGVDLRLELMRRHTAVTGFRMGELPVFEEKVAFLTRPNDPDVQMESLERAITLAGFPDVSSDPSTTDVNLERLLEIIDGDEVRQFRQWLRGIDSATDHEISSQVHPVRDAVSEAIRSGPGKAVRFVATTGLGAVAPPAGIAAGLLDTFLTEKVIGEPGPTAFLSQRFPTIFQ